MLIVDSYAYLPRAFRPMYENTPTFTHEPVWSPFEKSLSEARIALLSSSGIFLPGSQAPFDMETERQNPTWGDPTLRLIPASVTQNQVGASHLHINTADVIDDINVALPIHRLAELAADGVIGSVADVHFSTMGFQAEGAQEWRTETGPDIAGHCQDMEVDAVILAPA